MRPENLVNALLGNRRANEYIYSLPSGEFEEHLRSMEAPVIEVTEEDPEIYRLAGMSRFPVVYLEYGIESESDVPSHDVLRCIEVAKRQSKTLPKMTVSYLNDRQQRMLSMAIRFMCIAREEPLVKRVAPKRCRVIYECRIGERWVEVYLGKQVIPYLRLMTAS